MNNLISIKVIELIIRNISTKKMPGPVGFTGESY